VHRCHYHLRIHLLHHLHFLGVAILAIAIFIAKFESIWRTQHRNEIPSSDLLNVYNILLGVFLFGDKMAIELLVRVIEVRKFVFGLVFLPICCRE